LKTCPFYGVSTLGIQTKSISESKLFEIKMAQPVFPINPGQTLKDYAEKYNTKYFKNTA
jgi:hypothetical protein